MSPAPAPPSGASKAPMIVIIVVVVVVGGILVLGVLAALLLPAMARANRNARLASCANNLKQLWTMEANYMAQFGGREKLMPTATGGDFWLTLSRTNPPLIDAAIADIYECPFDPNATPRSTDYRGPSSNVNKYFDGDPVGADKVGLHGAGEGGIVLRKSGDAMNYMETDPVWAAAATKTQP